MAGYNLPDNVSANSPDAPWNLIEPVVHEDEISIRAALAEVAELESSLTHLDRHDPRNSYFIGWRSGEDPLFSAYRALRHIRKDLEAMLGED
jgi:hypothetical protein